VAAMARGSLWFGGRRFRRVALDNRLSSA
jgi:hypothetical protein